MMPPTVTVLAELLVHFWLAPRTTGAFTVSAGAAVDDHAGAGAVAAGAGVDGQGIAVGAEGEGSGLIGSHGQAVDRQISAEGGARRGPSHSVSYAQDHVAAGTGRATLAVPAASLYQLELPFMSLALRPDRR